MLNPLPDNPYKVGTDLLLDIKVTTNTHENKVCCWRDGYLLVRLKVAPERGKANSALIEVLAKEYGTSKSQIEIIAGLTSRKKRVRLINCSIQSIRKEL